MEETLIQSRSTDPDWLPDTYLHCAHWRPGSVNSRPHEGDDDWVEVFVTFDVNTSVVGSTSVGHGDSTPHLPFRKPLDETWNSLPLHWKPHDLVTLKSLVDSVVDHI